MLSRDQILALRVSPSELTRQEVPVPEWNDTVCVRVMTGVERDRFEVRLNETKRTNYRASLVAFTACDEKGVRLFTESDIAWLGELPATGLNRVAEVALKMNKFTDDDVKELQKNSEASPSVASS